MADFWTFLRDANNRALLGWLGGGVIAVAGAFGAIFKFAYSRKDEKSPLAPPVSATLGGVAAGRDIRDSKIETCRGRER